MLIIKDRDSASAVSDPAIRQMILQRIDAIASDEPYVSALHGYFLVLTECTTLQVINRQVGFDVLAKTPEILEEYSDCYDMLFIVDDSGYGIELFIPKSIDIPELIAMCELFAVPGTL